MSATLQSEKPRLGDLLVRRGCLTTEQLRIALADQARSGRKLGRIVVESAFATEEEIAQALAGQARASLLIPAPPVVNGAGAAVEPPRSSWLAPLRRRLDGLRARPLELQRFSRQLHALLDAGVPPLRALDQLQETTADRATQALLSDLRTRLKAGGELWRALASHPDVFPQFYVMMIRAGEASGETESVFARLVAHLEFEHCLREQAKSALRYPTLIVSALLLAVAVVNLSIIPVFASVFAGVGAELPVMTRLLVDCSDFTVSYWPFMIAGLCAAVLVGRLWLVTAGGRRHGDRLALALPVTGEIVRKAALARFAKSFALALHGGFPVAMALFTCVETSGNAAVSRRIARMQERVEGGESLLQAAVTAGVFAPGVLRMIAVGYEAGALGEAMDKIGDLYRDEVEDELKTLSQQIEPVLIVMLGLIVLVLALGIFLPLWELGRAAFGS